MIVAASEIADGLPIRDELPVGATTETGGPSLGDLVRRLSVRERKTVQNDGK
jgi:hypothetical protein